jgi:hypothetical protein
MVPPVKAREAVPTESLPKGRGCGQALLGVGEGVCVAVAVRVGLIEGVGVAVSAGVGV